MSPMTLPILLLLTLMTTTTYAATKGASAAPPVDCTSVVLSMSDCLSYVTNGSTVEKPEGTCCSGLKSVLKSSPDCLCQAFQQSAQFGVVLNVTKALALPTACHVRAPSPDNCGLSLAPASAPAGSVVSPVGAPSSSSIANAPTMSFGGNEMSPALAPAKTGASSSINVPIKLMFAVIATAVFSSL